MVYLKYKKIKAKQKSSSNKKITVKQSKLKQVMQEQLFTSQTDAQLVLEK